MQNAWKINIIKSRKILQSLQSLLTPNLNFIISQKWKSPRFALKHQGVFFCSYKLKSLKQIEKQENPSWYFATIIEHHRLLLLVHLHASTKSLRDISRNYQINPPPPEPSNSKDNRNNRKVNCHCSVGKFKDKILIVWKEIEKEREGKLRGKQKTPLELMLSINQSITSSISGIQQMLKKFEISQ